MGEDQKNNPIQTPPLIRKRHGCLTAWLIMLVVANPLSILLVLLFPDLDNTMPGWYLPLMIAISLINLAAALLLLNWRKVGFWLFCGTAIVNLVVNILIDVSALNIILQLLSVPLLFGLLYLGTTEKAWPQLH